MSVADTTEQPQAASAAIEQAGRKEPKSLIPGVDPVLARERALVRRRRMRRERAFVTVVQLLLVAAFLCGWQWLPSVHFLSAHSHAFDRFFISSPSRVYTKLVDMITGRNQSPKMWTYLKPTLEASVIGTAIGMVTGALAGLLLSNSPLLTKILHPFVVGINAVPRIALIPIIVIIGGIGLQTTVIISVLVVFFVTFFNAFEGGRTVSPQLLQNAKILGAKPWQIMWYVRRPYVFAWSMASLPLALTFSLLTVVTTEILTGQKGMGYLISFSTSTADATLTFASVVVLSVAGMAIVGISAIVKRRALRWWEAGN